MTPLGTAKTIAYHCLYAIVTICCVTVTTEWRRPLYAIKTWHRNKMEPQVVFQVIFDSNCIQLNCGPDPKVSSEVDLLRLMLRGSSVKATLLRPESWLDSSLVAGGHKFRDSIQ